MIHLLFAAVGVEAGVVVLLLANTPLRRLVLLAFDRLKRGQGPIAVRTVAATISVVLASSIYGMVKIRRGAGGEDQGLVSLSPTDQVLLTRHLLEASLMGFLLFLALVIDRMHHHIRELRVLRSTVESVTKPSGGSDDPREEAPAPAPDQEILRLKARIAELESDCEARQQ